MKPRRRPLVLVVVMAALVALTLFVLPDPTEVVVAEEVGQQTTQPASAGVWYCPSTDSAATTRVALAAPPGGERPSVFQANDFRGSPDGAETGEVFPGAGSSPELLDPSRAIRVRWNDRPLVTSRLAIHDGEIEGPVIGPCASSVATTWFVAGVTTAAGAEAELHVGNPFPTEAAVAVEFLTEAGLESPLAVQNVPVPERGTAVIDISEVMPQREDLGVRVTARSGRVAVEGVQSSIPTISGVQGRSWVGATERVATSWHLPWVGSAGDGTAGFGDPDDPDDEAEDEADQDRESTDDPTDAPTDPDDIEVVVEGEADPSSWVWVANPSAEEVAELNVSLLTPAGRVVPDVAAPLRVQPESVLRVDLEPWLADVSGDVGVQVVSTNDVGVAVGGGAVVAAEADVERTGLAILSAQRSPDTSWTITAAAGDGREHLLTIGNPTEESARVNVSAWTGVTNVRPADLQELLVQPGQNVTVELGELDLSGSTVTVFVDVTEGEATASLRSASDDGPLGLSVPAAVPSRTWVSSGIVTTVRREGGMANRFGTGLGLDDVEPSPTPAPAPPPDDATPSETPSSSPTPTPTSEAPSTTPTETSTSTDDGS